MIVLKKGLWGIEKDKRNLGFLFQVELAKGKREKAGFRLKGIEGVPL